MVTSSDENKKINKFGIAAATAGITIAGAAFPVIDSNG